MKDYEILSGDTVVAIWKDNILKIKNKTLLPLYLQNFADANAWLITRAIDTHRANSRLLKKALRMRERDDLSTAIRANGVTITDNYWIREVGSDLNYSDVCFDEKYFKKSVAKSAANLALRGSSSAFNVVAENSKSTIAELTNIGSFEKCWKNIDGKWWLFKTANKYECFSEVFISNLCEVIGIPCAKYEKHDKYIKTLDFTSGNFNFEPANAFMGDDEDYEHVIKKLSQIYPNAIPDYIRMIFLDALVFNPDRHTANFGLLRDKKDGKIISFAPCFDHNMALISRGYPAGKLKKDLLINLFDEVMENHPEYKKFIPVVTEADIDLALSMTNMKVKSKLIKDYIMFRYNMICDKI